MWTFTAGVATTLVLIVLVTIALDRLNVPSSDSSRPAGVHLQARVAD